MDFIKGKKMKNKMTVQQKIATALLILKTFALSVLGCEKEPTPTPGPECKCPPAATHFLECDDYGCEVGGHQQKAREYITDNAGNQVPIYQKSADPAVNAVAGTMAGNIRTEYDEDIASKADLSGKIKEIWIVKGTENQIWYFDYTIVGNQIILKLQYDNPYIDSIFYELSTNVLPGLDLPPINPKSGVQVTKAPVPQYKCLSLT